MVLHLSDREARACRGIQIADDLLLPARVGVIGENSEVALGRGAVVALIIEHIPLAQTSVDGCDKVIAAVRVVGSLAAALETLVGEGGPTWVKHAHGRALDRA